MLSSVSGLYQVESIQANCYKKDQCRINNHFKTNFLPPEFSKIDADDESEATVDIIHMAKDLSRNHKELTEDEATLLLTKQLQEHQHHNAGWYRVHAVRGLTGGHRLLPKINHTLREVN